MNAINSIKMLTVLNEELKSMDFKESKGKKVDLARREAIKELVTSIKKQILINIQHVEIEALILNENDRYIGQHFEKVTTEELQKASEKKPIENNIKQLLELEDPFWHLVKQIKNEINKNHDFFDMDEDLLEIYFTPNGEKIGFLAETHTFCNERDYCEGSILISELFD